MATKIDFTLEEGKTFRRRVRWFNLDKHVYVPIASMSQSGPLVVETQVAHGIPDGWEAAIVSANGMVTLNAKSNPPKANEYHKVTRKTDTEVEFNSINSAGFPAYTTGGYLQFFEPMPLDGTVPRWVVKDVVDGAVLVEATEANGLLSVNNVAKYYEILLDVDDTTDLGWTKGVHELESRDPSIPFTYKVIYGKIRVGQEIATAVTP